ncbi:hypothetical protein K438DRAFT_1964483 [Mycena galopus ATCC 62051]|nr:hypothetical protein K438DRAFT_1964483 [Mycena galopus ATCC 62051]
MAGSMSLFLHLIFIPIFVTIFVSPSSAQTVTGTLFGVAYPSAAVQTGARSAYLFTGAVPWIVNQPHLSIVGIDTIIGQTTFAYQDVYTERTANAASALTIVTESGILVQNTAGLYFTEPASVARNPVVQSCTFNKAGAASCEVNNGVQGTTTIGGTRTPLYTFTAVLPALKASAGSKASGAAPSGTGTAQSASHKVPVGAIVGAAIGVVVVVGGALAGLLFYRRRRQQYTGEKVELDLEQGRESAFMPLESGASVDSRPQPLPSSYAPASVDADTEAAPTSVASTNTNAPPPPETQRQRRRRLKQMQVTVQELQRNLSVASPGGDDTESQIVAQQRQIDMLMEEVGHLRAIVARDEALPVYEE